MVPSQSVRSASWRYSYASYQHGVFVAPGSDFGSDQEEGSSTLYIRDVNGDWRQFANRPNYGMSSIDGIRGFDQSSSSPFEFTQGLRGVWPHCENDKWSSGRMPYRECLGGGYILQPCVLIQRSPSKMVYGELEGVYATSGYQNTSENTTTINGKTHVVFQNAYRTTVHEYWALSLD